MIGIRPPPSIAFCLFLTFVLEHKSGENIAPMQRPKFFFVGGVNGSGKTTVLHLISEKKPEFHVIKGSEYFMKWLGIKRRNYGQLQSLPDRKTLLELGRMMRYLLKEKKYSNNKKIVLIDAHFTNIRNGKTEEWISDWLSLVNGLVLIKAKPAEMVLQT